MLDLFSGELSKDDIYGMTYKELGYLKKNREARKKANAGIDEAAAITAALTGRPQRKK